MTTVVPMNIKVPAHLANRLGKESSLAQALAGGLASGISAPRISIKGSRFRIIEDDVETVLEATTLDVIIVGANPHLSKIWFAQAWTPDSESQAPDCFSFDGVRPDPSVLEPQNDLCATCPRNVWGSKVTPQGQLVKDCADQKRLAVVAADDPGGKIYLLTVPPASLKNLNQYQKELTMRGIPPEIVKTRISFDTAASFPKLRFVFGGFLDEQTQQIVDNLFGSDEVKQITGEALEKPVMPKPVVKAALPVEDTEETPQAPVPAHSDVPKRATAPKRGFGTQSSETTTVASKRGFSAQPETTTVAPKRGFSAQPETTTIPKREAEVVSVQPKTVKRAVNQAKAATQLAAETEAAVSLADEIAALLEEVGDDADDA